MVSTAFSPFWLATSRPGVRVPLRPLRCPYYNVVAAQGHFFMSDRSVTLRALLQPLGLLVHRGVYGIPLRALWISGAYGATRPVVSCLLSESGTEPTGL